jgi:hypothetical protein
MVAKRNDEMKDALLTVFGITFATTVFIATLTALAAPIPPPWQNYAFGACGGLLGHWWWRSL